MRFCITILLLSALVFLASCKDIPASDESVLPPHIAALDAEFEAQTPEPDGSTASMLAYAEAYLDLWQREIDALITASPSLSDDFAAFEYELEKELAALEAEYKSDDGTLYGSAVTYELIWHHATALRDWLIEYYS